MIGYWRLGIAILASRTVALLRALATALHRRVIKMDSCHPHLRTSAAACARPRSDTRVRDRATGAAESGSTLRRAEELHRTTPAEAPPDALRTRAVLLGGNGAEPKTAGAIPQHSARTRTGDRVIAGSRLNSKATPSSWAGRQLRKRGFFNTHA